MQASALWAVAFLLAPAPRPETSPRGDGAIPVIVSAIDHVPLPAQEAGVLSELKAREGAIVKKDDALGRIDDSDAQARLTAAKVKQEVAIAKAENDAEVRSARKIIEVARAEYEESVEINKRSPGSIPETQLRRQLLQWERSKLEAEVKEVEHRIAALDCKLADAEVQVAELGVKRRKLIAPFDGVVVQQYRQQSEWVQAGEPIIRLIRMDRLRVEGFVSASKYAPHEVLGAEVDIEVKLAGKDTAKKKGTIGFVSAQVEASGDFRVWAEVENEPGRGGYPWLLRPGLEAEMTITRKAAR